MKQKLAKGICLAVVLAMLTGCAEKTTEPETLDKTKENAEVAATDIILDYAQGIADGIYGWNLSEDGSYYMLSAINKDGTPVESTTQQKFKNGGGKGGGNFGREGQNGKRDEMDYNQDKLEGIDGEKKFEMKGSNGESDDPLAMERNQQAFTQNVNAQGVYIEKNITNTEYQTMLVFVPV